MKKYISEIYLSEEESSGISNPVTSAGNYISRQYDQRVRQPINRDANNFVKGLTRDFGIWTNPYEKYIPTKIKDSVKDNIAAGYKASRYGLIGAKGLAAAGAIGLGAAVANKLLNKPLKRIDENIITKYKKCEDISSPYESDRCKIQTIQNEILDLRQLYMKCDDEDCRQSISSEITKLTNIMNEIIHGSNQFYG